MLKKINISDLFDKPERELCGSLAIPSVTHGYSLCIEYAKDWFFKKISRDFFNGVYVDGKYVLDEYKKFTDIESQIQKRNPVLAITPNMDIAYNRDFIDFTPNMLGIDNYIKRSRMEAPFFEDYYRNTRLLLSMKAIQVGFNFKIRLNTRAAQLDLRDFMLIAYKAGATSGEYINQDYQLPYDLIINIAKDAGFTVIKNRVVDIMKFMHYLNSNSKLPITYKFRGSTGRCEFFIRVKDQYVHTRINEVDKDDGQRKNHIETDFTIEMNTVVTFPVPQYYMYYSEIRHSNIATTLQPMDAQTIGLYALNMTKIPDLNNKGWQLYMTTDILEDDLSKPLFIDNLMDLFYSINNEESDIQKIIRICLETNINPFIFIDMKLFNNGNEIPASIDWDKGILKTKDKLEWQKSIMAIYIDKVFLNEQLINLEKQYKTRIE